MSAPDARAVYLVQILLLGVMLPIAFYFLLQVGHGGGLRELVAGMIVLAASLAACWSIWKHP